MMPVMYTEYLQNMGVAAALVMPLIRDGRLWGLIATHHYTPKDIPHHVRVRWSGRSLRTSSAMP